MKTNRLLPLFAVILTFMFSGATELLAQNPTADLEALVARIEAKRRAGRYTEMELAHEVNEFSDLLNKYRGQKTNEVAMILFVKANLYLQAFHDLEMGVNLLEQVKADFPRTDVALMADDLLQQIRTELQEKRAGNKSRNGPGG